MKTNIAGLTTEESILFIEVFDASLRVNKREQFFSWLQGSFQSLLPHEILLCGVKLSSQPQIHFESFITTRYFTQHHVQLATNQIDGVITRAITAWKKNYRPIMIADGLSLKDSIAYQVPFVEPLGALQDIELKNIAAHGVATKEGEVITFFSFSRVSGELDSRCAYILELMIPHMHAAFLRIFVTHQFSKSKRQLSEINQVKLVLTLREIEVLKWVGSGKTNPEIASILYISINTVKNHVHSAIAKLAVENRAQASSKATMLGILR